MALAYVPPGVTVTEIVSDNIAPLLAVPASICIIGMASGYLRRTDIMVLSGTTATPIPFVPENATLNSGSIVSVKDALNPANAPNGYAATTDYVFNATNKTIARVNTGTMPDPCTVYVTYNYYPSDYYNPTRLFNMADIEKKYGSAYDASGTAVNSPLSFAASLAFENGASNVVCQALFYQDPDTGVKSQPSDSQAAAPTNTWAPVYASLRDIEDINIFVPIFGQSMPNVNDAAWLTIAYAGQDHLRFLTQENRHAIMLLGEDSSTTTSAAQLPTLQAHAQQIAARYAGQLSEAIAMVSPSKYTRETPFSLGKVYIGGQYVAACLSGMMAARATSNPLTRKGIAGIKEVADYRSKADKNADASAGLMVIEQRGTKIQPRHAITLDNTSVARRELSVVRSKYRMIESVRQTLETQVIGQVIADAKAPDKISHAVASVLEALKGTQDLVAYSNVQTRISALDPTTAEVRFSYKPAFPINYIDIYFSLDLSSGDLGVNSNNSFGAAN